MKTITTFSLLLFAFFATKILQSQTTPNIFWAKQYGGVNYEYVVDTTTDHDGNIYMTGGFWYQTNFENITLTSQGSGATFVAKTDPLGTLLWVSQFGGSGHDTGKAISVDNLGNVYTTGTFTNIATFGSTTLDAGNSPDVFVVKQDPLGNVLWVTPFNTQGTGFANPESIVTDTQGNVYTLGHFDSPSLVIENITFTLPSESTRNVFVVKQDSSGNVLWAKSFGGTGSASSVNKKITTDSSDNIYFMGVFGETIDFGTTTLTNSDQQNDIFLVKLDPFGEVVWAKHFEVNISSNSLPFVYGNTTDQAGNVYFTGNFYGTFQIGEITLTSSDSAIENTFVVKTDNLGEPLWAKSFSCNSSAVGLGITTNALGEVYVAGVFTGTIDFDGIIFSSTSGTSDAFVLKMDDLGTVKWVRKYGGQESAGARTIAVDTNQDVLVSGVFNFMITFGTTMLTSNGGGDIFLLKLSPDGLTTNNNQTENWKIYPNPTSNFVTLDFPDNTEEISVEIFNMLGQKVKTFENLNSIETLDLSHLTTGIYLLNVKSNEINQTLKIKKQ